MDKHNAALGLARQGWSCRRIGAELGIDRGTVARHVRAPAAQVAAANAAISIAGFDPPDSQGASPPGALPDGLPQPLTPAAPARRIQMPPFRFLGRPDDATAVSPCANKTALPAFECRRHDMTVAQDEILGTAQPASGQSRRDD